jgi:hypothetical protein
LQSANSAEGLVSGVERIDEPFSADDVDAASASVEESIVGVPADLATNHHAPCGHVKGLHVRWMPEDTHGA